MQTANILLMLGGDRDNQIPKFGVTPSEVAVLRLIHGDEAVTDIEPIGEVKRSSKEERQRLTDIYARIQPNGGRRAVEVEALFPGAAARVFETFDEIDIDESFFKAETRVATKKADPLDHDGDGKKAAAAQEEQPEEQPETENEDADVENDGIGDMNDNLFK